MNPIGRARHENISSFIPKALAIPYTSIPHQRNVFLSEDEITGVTGVTGVTGTSGVAMSLLECDTTYPYDRRNKALAQNQTGENLLSSTGSILLNSKGFPLQMIGE
jgi:hypothetical protein